MAVLLARQQAAQPYRIGKLNLRVWNEQELCWLMGNYPLVFLDTFPEDSLLTWLGTQLGMDYVAEKLAAFRDGFESRGNMMLYFLQNCNYYNQQELSDLKKKLRDYGKMSREELLHAEALALFDAGRLSAAYDRLVEARDALDEHVKQTEELSRRAELLKRKAGYYCDMAAVRLRLFDDKKALELLRSSELYAKTARARLMLGLMEQTEGLTEEERGEASARLAECRENALGSASYQKTAELFEKDRIRIEEGAREQLAAWQTDYRRML